MNYTIQSINNDGSIDVSFDIDGVVQNLSGAPLTDVDALNQFLFDYGTAYENGIVQTSSPVISPDVEAPMISALGYAFFRWSKISVFEINSLEPNASTNSALSGLNPCDEDIEAHLLFTKCCCCVFILL